MASAKGAGRPDSGVSAVSLLPGRPLPAIMLAVLVRVTTGPARALKCWEGGRGPVRSCRSRVRSPEANRRRRGRQHVF